MDFAAGIHQVDLGLSRHPGQRRPARPGPRDPRQIQAQFDAAEKAYGVDRYAIAAIWGIELNYSTQMAIAACCNPPRRWPASAAARNISGTNFSPRWKSCTTAICVPNRCAVPGRARSARRNSCRLHSNATRSMATAMAAGRGRRPHRPDRIHRQQPEKGRLAGRPGSGDTRSWSRNFDYMLADRAKAMTIAQWEHLGIGAPATRPFRNLDGLFACSRRRRGSGFPDAAEFPGLHEIQPGRGLCAGDRPLCRSVARRFFFVQPWPRQERCSSRAERLELQQLLVPAGLLSRVPPRPDR